MLPVLNPKSYHGARVLEASGRPMLVIGRSSSERRRRRNRISVHNINRMNAWKGTRRSIQGRGRRRGRRKSIISSSIISAIGISCTRVMNKKKKKKKRREDCCKRNSLQSKIHISNKSFAPLSLYRPVTSITGNKQVPQGKQTHLTS